MAQLEEHPCLVCGPATGEPTQTRLLDVSVPVAYPACHSLAQRPGAPCAV